MPLDFYSSVYIDDGTSYRYAINSYVYRAANALNDLTQYLADRDFTGETGQEDIAAFLSDLSDIYDALVAIADELVPPGN